MSVKMHIVLEGLPERVQETADVLDRALPGTMTWSRFAAPGRDNTVRLEGKAVETKAEFIRPQHVTNRTFTSGKAWKLSRAAGRVSSHCGAFCASLSNSLLHEREVDGGAADITADQ